MHHVRSLVLALLLGSAFLSTAAQTRSQKGGQSSPSQQQREVAQLRQAVAELRAKIAELEVKEQFSSYLVTTKQDRQDSITLNLSERTFQRLDTDNGFFLVSVNEAVPYLNGYKLRLQIGNPSYASYSGFKAKVKWRKRYDYSQFAQATYDEWQKGIQEREVSFTDVLQRGTWNKIELVVTPATVEQLGHVELSLTTEVLQLYEKSENAK